ncbi:MAG TPA: D-arabinono-1,4-lactone oxidase [Acidimicrobiales bacterium]|nr:D-arabinono-1,4-lactone oxidase [Acidimicrobiales bacterium]
MAGDVTSAPPLRNWAGNLSYAASSLERPQTLEQLQEIVARSEQVHAVGARHSFSDAADTPGRLVSLDDLPRRVEIDRRAATVTVSAATRFAELAAALEQEGLALANLASLPHLSVAGACATATHGSGDANTTLSGLVAALELVGADGELVTRRRDTPRRQLGPGGDPAGGEVTEGGRMTPGEELDGSVVACGALGVVSAVTLDVVPSFMIRQDVYDDLSFERAVVHLDELFAEAYSVSVFVDWRRPHVAQIWRKSLVEPGAAAPPDLLGALAARQPRHPIAGCSARPCTEQLGRPGPWNERLPHFRAEEAPSAAGAELQSEYLVGRDRAPEALERLAAHHDRLAPLVQVSELRSVAPDELWLSPAYRRSSIAIHFTWVPDPASVLAVLPLVESELAHCAARPHWGKLFVASSEQLAERYERFADFGRLLERYDPAGKFANAFSKRCLPAR